MTREISEEAPPAHQDLGLPGMTYKGPGRQIVRRHSQSHYLYRNHIKLSAARGGAPCLSALGQPGAAVLELI